MHWAWLKTNISLSELISCLACSLDTCALPDSLVTLSALKLCLAVDARWAHRVRLGRPLVFALQDFSLFWPEIVRIFSSIPIKDTLKIAIQTKQDLYTNSYKITKNWGIIQVLENVSYTKVSRIRRLTNSPKFTVLLVLKQRKNSSLVLKWQNTVVNQGGVCLTEKFNHMKWISWNALIKCISQTCSFSKIGMYALES